MDKINFQNRSVCFHSKIKAGKKKIICPDLQVVNIELKRRFQILELRYKILYFML